MTNTQPIRLALIGCGGMGLRHLHGLIELKRCGFETVNLVAVCDMNPDNAAHVVGVAQAELGVKPKIYTDFAQLLETEKCLDAIDLVTDPISHHTLACAAFDAGVHVMVEKPMGVTVRACRLMLERATKSGCKLAVAENYRRDPMNRLLKAVIDAEVIGRPYMVLHNNIAGGGSIMSGTLWRHQKVRGGYLIEMGVHYGDMLVYLLGEIDAVYAATAMFEEQRERRGASKFYAHRLKNEPTSMRSDAEETATATLKFANGALGQFILSMAGHGRGVRTRQFFGAKGSIDAPGDRSGNPIRLKLDDRDELSGDAILDLVPDFRLDPINQQLFGFERAGSYDLPFESIDHKLLAYEYQDFVEAIRDNRAPDVDGQGGLIATAFAYALCESGHLGAPVSLKAVAEDQINAYQAEINENAGL
jgi:predicted dehydrogenase